MTDPLDDLPAVDNGEPPVSECMVDGCERDPDRHIVGFEDVVDEGWFCAYHAFAAIDAARSLEIDPDYVNDADS
jgi:hypothetical protein